MAGNGVRETETQRPPFALTRQRVKRKQHWEKGEQIGDDEHPIYHRRLRPQIADCTQVDRGIFHPPDAFEREAQARSCPGTAAPNLIRQECVAAIGDEGKGRGPFVKIAGSLLQQEIQLCPGPHRVAGGSDVFGILPDPFRVRPQMHHGVGYHYGHEDKRR